MGIGGGRFLTGSARAVFIFIIITIYFADKMTSIAIVHRKKEALLSLANSLLWVVDAEEVVGGIDRKGSLKCGV